MYLGKYMNGADVLAVKLAGESNMIHNGTMLCRADTRASCAEILYLDVLRAACNA